MTQNEDENNNSIEDENNNSLIHSLIPDNGNYQLIIPDIYNEHISCEVKLRLLYSLRLIETMIPVKGNEDKNINPILKFAKNTEDIDNLYLTLRNPKSYDILQSIIKVLDKGFIVSAGYIRYKSTKNFSKDKILKHLLNLKRLGYIKTYSVDNLLNGLKDRELKPIVNLSLTLLYGIPGLDENNDSYTKIIDFYSTKTKRYRETKDYKIDQQIDLELDKKKLKSTKIKSNSNKRKEISKMELDKKSKLEVRKSKLEGYIKRSTKRTLKTALKNWKLELKSIEKELSK